MYVITREGLGQAPVLSGSVAGMLGDVSEKKRVEDFLATIRQNRRYFNKFLLVAWVHHDFINSKTLDELRVWGFVQRKIVELVLLSGTTADEFRNALRLIAAEFSQQDGDFRQKLDAEEKLGTEINMNLPGDGCVPESIRQDAGKLSQYQKRLRPFLLKAALGGGADYTAKKCPLALSFVQEMLPSLQRRIIDSDASEAHLANICAQLQYCATVLQRENRDFAREVERAKRQGPAQRRRRQQPGRRR
jgi:hypothetical protein